METLKIVIRKPVIHRELYVLNLSDKLVDLSEAPGYKITDKGTVISYKYPTPYIVKPYIIKGNILVVDLRKDNKYVHIRVNKLLAKYFPKEPPVGYKQIYGHYGYFINKNGDVISDNPLNNNYKGRIQLHSFVGNGGYVYVRINNKNYLLHRLVALTFIPNPYNFPQVNHKDENKQNNSVDNLEWCDSQYNNTYNGKSYRATRWACKKCKLIDLKENTETICDSINYIAAHLRVNKGTVTYHIKNKSVYNNRYRFELYGTD